jgi:hypothetical protein
MLFWLIRTYLLTNYGFIIEKVAYIIMGISMEIQPFLLNISNYLYHLEYLIIGLKI